jgi:hypothetical protein
MLESQLTAVDPKQWVTSQVVVFDWYDGPRVGICALAHPRVEFFFTAVQEPLDGDSSHTRVYQLSELPLGSVENAVAALRCLGEPRQPVWTPIWRFPNEAAEARVNHVLEKLRPAAHPSCSVLIESADLVHFGKLFFDGRAPNPALAAP